MSFRGRIALLSGLLVIVAIIAAGTSGFLSTRSQLNAGIDGFLRTRSAEIADGVRDVGRGRGNDAEAAEIVASAFEPDSVYQLLDGDGKVAVTGYPRLPVSSSDRNLAERSNSPKIRTIEIDGQQYRMITRHINPRGAVQVARSLTETNTALSNISSQVLLTAIGLSLMAASLGWVLASSLTKPLRSLATKAEHVSVTQDLSVSMDLGRNDEVGSVSQSFDKMLSALRESRDQQHRLIQDAAHEFRTPLTTIRANIEFLERAKGLGEPQRSDIFSSLTSEIGELSTLFTEVIELATDSRDSQPFSTISLNEPAERAVLTFSARSSRTLHTRFDGVDVLGNVEMLERAISNLLGNADKYSIPDGAVYLTVSGTTLVVSDEGPGIPAEVQEHVFERFYRADGARSMAGSGLGLAIVKHIVDQHQGRVHAGTSKFNGAEVGFTLPNGISR